MPDLLLRLIQFSATLPCLWLIITPALPNTASALPEADTYLLSQVPVTTEPEAQTELDLDPTLIERSPTLQRWLEEVPDLQSDIRHDPSFRTRLRLGYSQFPSTDHAAGLHVGVEDIFIDRSGFTVSADYQTAFDGEREAYGSDLRYYVLPLGDYVNLAPVVGYRSIAGEDYQTDGVNVGFRVLVIPSRTGAADLSFTQTWVAPGSEQEVGVSTLTVGYAITNQLRVAADVQKQNAPQAKDSRVGIGLEWMF